MKKRELERHLKTNGCRLAREASKHELWKNPATGQRTTVPRHREIRPHTARGICRQLGAWRVSATPRGKTCPEICRELSNSDLS